MTTLFDKIRKTMMADVFANRQVGIEIDSVDELSASCSLSIKPLHLNAAGVVMGGVLFTLADFTFAVAANAESIANNEGVQWMSIDSHINFLSRVQGDKITASCTPIHRGKTTAVYSIRITDAHNHLVAQITTTGIKNQIILHKNDSTRNKTSGGRTIQDV